MKFKKLFTVILGIITAAGLSVSASSAAEPAVITESVERQALSGAGDTYRSGGLLYTELDDGTYEVGYDYDYGKPSGKVTIPQTVNGKTVTRIAESGFYRCHDLTSISLPKTVVSAGENAFTGTALVSEQSWRDIRYAGHLAVECATDAEEVTVREGTLGLSDKLFALSPNIYEVDLPDSLVNLGSNTFAGCSKLRYADIPDGITEIKDGVFYGCVNYDPDIPSSVESIGAYALANSGYTWNNLPHLKKIGKSAFENSKLDDLSVSDGAEIGGRAFAGTPFYNSLGDVKYVGNVCVGADSRMTNVTLKNGTLRIADMAFTDCTHLKSVTIPAGVKTIGSDAFFACGSLTTVTIGEGVESIGEDAFRLCTKLNTISLPKSLKAVYDGAFYGCNKLSAINYGGSIVDWAGLACGEDNSPLLNASITFGAEPKRLAAVTNLTVTNASYDRVSFSWTPSEGAVVYDVYQNNGGSWKKIDELPGDSDHYTADGLSGNTSYSFRVTARTGTLTASANISAATGFDNMYNLKASPDEDSVALSWNKNTGAAYYRVDKAVDGEWVEAFRTSNSSTTSCTITGLSPLTQYSFRVIGVSSGGAECEAAEVSTTTLASTVPDAVGNLTATEGFYNVSLSWDKSELADRYQLEVLKDGRWSVVNSKITETSYNVTGLNANTEYRFRVFAFNGSKYSRSATVTATTLDDTPAPVTNLTAAESFYNVSLSWDKSELADRYQLEVLKDGRWSVVNSKITATSYNVTGLNANTEYHFRIFAFNGSKYSRSATVTATTLNDAPAPVTNLTAAEGANNVLLSWEASPTADRYQLEVLKDGRWSVVNSKITATSYNVTGLNGLTEYRFRVFAFKGSKYSSSAAVTVTTLNDTPDAIQNFDYTATASTVSLTWDKSELADRYQIEILKDGRWSVVNSKVTSTSYTVTGLNPLTEYRFRIFAFCGSKYSRSATVAATTLEDLPPDAVENFDFTASATAIALSWDASPTADRYQIEVLKDGRWSVVNSKVTSTSYTVTGLNPLTEYRFRIFAFCGSKYSRSTTVAATTLEDLPPEAVTDFTAEPTSDSVALSWTESLGADRYQIEVLKDGRWSVVNSKVTSTSYTVTGLNELTEYRFRIFAFCGSKYSRSATVAVTTLEVLPPDAVENLTATAGANYITLSWSASPTADRYQIEVLKDGRWSVVNSKVTSTSYKVTGLNALTQYRFRIFAFKGSKYSRSAMVEETTLTDVPEPVTNLDAEVGTYNISLSWTKSELADRYQIEVLRDGRWYVVNSKVTGTSYNVTGLDGLTEYKFRIFAFNGSKYSKSATITATTLTDIPEPVTNLSVTAVGMYNVNLSWTESELADRYQIEVLKDGRWSVVNSKVTGTSYNVTGLDGLTEYRFRIFAFNGSKYSKSTAITATTLTDIPDAVTNVKASDIETRRFTLSWSKSEIADKYRIEMLSGGAWKSVATTTALSYNVTSLLPNTEYTFRVIPMRAAKSGDSVEITLKTDSKPPEAVRNLEAIAKAGSVKLLWERSLLADSYQIDMEIDNKWVNVVKTSATSYNVTGLGEGVSYRFRVRAINYVEYSPAEMITVVTKASLAPVMDLSTQYGASRLMMKGIDVSGWQGDVDFNAVKKSGVDFVIIKAGYSTSTVDTWETNYAKAKKAGLKVGAYWYSYATTLSQGRAEARAFVRAMDGKELDFPVYFDLEESAQFNKGMTFCTNLVEAFCGEVEDAGYLAGVYCSRYWYTNYVSESTRLSRPTWIADYSRACDYGGSYGIWQYGIGFVDGIDGKVDLNWAYTDYSSFIKRKGLNGY